MHRLISTFCFQDQLQWKEWNSSVWRGWRLATTLGFNTLLVSLWPHFLKLQTSLNVFCSQICVQQFMFKLPHLAWRQVYCCELIIRNSIELTMQGFQILLERPSVQLVSNSQIDFCHLFDCLLHITNANKSLGNDWNNILLLWQGHHSVPFLVWLRYSIQRLVRC